MDNASKALIMAGAILLAVAIVGLGVYFFSMSESLTDNAGDSITNLSTDLQNAELLKYEGANVRGNELRTLARKIDQIDDDWAESFEISGACSDVAGMKTLGKNKVYKVEMELGSSGFVKKITITQN